MPFDPSAVTWMLFTFWFVVYWVFGGVFFAIIAATRFIHTRKAVFSCLFTGGSIVAAYGAAVIGLLLARPNGLRCPEHVVAQGMFRNVATVRLQDVLLCDARSIMISGILFFALLLTIGMVALLVSRVEKQK
jgi:hypothetical protein